MKKLVSLLLAMTILACTPCVYATAANSEPELVTEISVGDGIIATAGSLSNYDVLTMAATIVPKALGFVECCSSCVYLPNGIEIMLTCTLQRTKTGSWSDYKSIQKYLMNGTNGYTVGDTWFAPIGYKYRTKTRVQVVADKTWGVRAGVILDDITIYSPIVDKT